MSIELKDYLFNSGAALVLHGERELVDADLAQLRNFSQKQRAAITSVVLSNTHITGACFQHLVLLPNLTALYGGGTRVKDDAPFDLLSRTIEILNLDRTEVSDRCILKLMNLPRLRLLSLRQTGITDNGLHLMAAMPDLREYYLSGAIVSDYAQRRLDSTIKLDSITFATALHFFLCTIQIGVGKFIRLTTSLTASIRAKGIPQDKVFHRCREHTMYSIEYSVSIIPEKGFQILYGIFDMVGELLQMANERALILGALSVSNSSISKGG
ncbi:MAG: hypothetical protein ABFS45_24510 [Pseudomonadota bacterium]